MEHTYNIARTALDYNPQGKRKQGRSKNNWSGSTLAVLLKTGTSFEEVKAAAQKVVRWRSMADAQCSQGDEEE